ncbi:MAG: ATP-binding protein [Phycisphaerae bacterium]|jgi:predicted HTH transcriptional regulator
MNPLRIFISSVQKEFTTERRAVKSFIQADPLLSRFFTVFVFEDTPARGRRADDVYLGEVERAAVYVGLFGDDYGFEDATGVSPTEREFDRATELGKERLIFIKAPAGRARHPKMQALIRKAEAQITRRTFSDVASLTAALAASLVDYLEDHGIIQHRPWEDRPVAGAELADLEPAAIATFVERARAGRRFPLAPQAAVSEVLAHLSLLQGGRPTTAALLLFGRQPQHFVPAAEVRCMHFHGTEVERPAPSYQVFKGALFDQVDRAVDFVLSVLRRGVGTRSESNRAPVSYEIPREVISEAVVNAVAHRDYVSPATVQVSVFADRIEIWNPGRLTPPLTPEGLRHPHNSIAHNPRIAEALFLAGYIEKFGTGTLMMIRRLREQALPEPDFAQREGVFIVTLWRDWLTAGVLAALNLNERQVKALAFLKTGQRIANPEYRKVTGTTKKTATRDLLDLTRKGVLRQRGIRGPGVHYVFANKGDRMGTMGTQTSPKGKQRGLKAKLSLRKRGSKGTKGTTKARKGTVAPTRKRPGKRKTP